MDDYIRNVYDVSRPWVILSIKLIPCCILHLFLWYCCCVTDSQMNSK